MSQITVSGHMRNLAGVNVAGSVVFNLVNYGDALPRILGTNAIVPVSITFQADNTGFWVGQVNGNDTIDPGGTNTPPTTYYSLTFVDPLGKVIQSLPFQFVGTGPANLDSQAPLVTVPTPGPVPNNAALLGSNNFFTGNNTFTGKNVISAQSIEGVLYADQFNGADMGAKINAAYAACPTAPSCTIIMVPQGTFNYTTPITFPTVGVQVILQGMGSSQIAGTSNVGGTVLNYTPTTGSAITIDWTPSTGGGYTPGGGIRDLTLVNNPASLTNGGSGSSAIGVNIGPVNGGAHKALFQNVRVMGFGTGTNTTDTGVASWGMEFNNCSWNYNNTGVSFAMGEEQTMFIQCVSSANGVNFNYASTATSGDTTYIGGSIDSATTMGVECNASNQIFSAIGTHWENKGVSGNVHYTHGTGCTINLTDCLAENDNASPSSAPWFDGAFFNVKGLSVASGGAGLSGFLFNVRNLGEIHVTSNNASLFPPTSIAFIGAGTTVVSNDPTNGIQMFGFKLPTILGSNNVTLLNRQAPAATITGTGSAATLYSYSLPGNIMAAAKGIRVTCHINHSTGTASTQYAFNFGATSVVFTTSGNSGYGQLCAEVWNNAGVTNAQTVTTTTVIGATSDSRGTTSSSIDTTAPVTITCTFNVVSSDAVTPAGFEVELIQ